MASVIDAAKSMGGQVMGAAKEVVKQVGEDIQAMHKSVNLMMGSVAFHTVEEVSLKNADYLGKEVSGWDPDLLTARAHYVESGVISFVCFVHNCVLALIFGVCALVSLFKDAKLNFTAKKLLLVAGLSGICIGTSAVGVCSPHLAHKIHNTVSDSLWENRDMIQTFLK